MTTTDIAAERRVQAALDELAADTTTDEAAADTIAERLQHLGYRGRPFKGCACPLARYLIDRTGGRVSVGGVGVMVGAGLHMVEMPPAVAWFVHRFDQGHYPRLLPRPTQLRQWLAGRSPRWDDA